MPESQERVQTENPNASRRFDAVSKYLGTQHAKADQQENRSGVLHDLLSKFGDTCRALTWKQNIGVFTALFFGGQVAASALEVPTPIEALFPRAYASEIAPDYLDPACVARIEKTNEAAQKAYDQELAKKGEWGEKRYRTQFESRDQVQRWIRGLYRDGDSSPGNQRSISDTNPVPGYQDPAKVCK